MQKNRGKDFLGGDAGKYYFSREVFSFLATTFRPTAIP
jgi:hypothetical protein